MPTRVLVAIRLTSARARLVGALEEAGFVVGASCDDAAGAIAAATRRRLDVCILHLDLPGGGITACRAISSRSRAPRILVMAPPGREADVTAALRAGADGFVVDDLDPTSVPHAASEVAAGRPVLSTDLMARLIAELRAPHTVHKEST